MFGLFKKKQKDPLFELYSDGEISNDGKLKLDMKWNDEFINKLRSQGLSGATDEDCVKQYMTVLFGIFVGIEVDAEIDPENHIQTTGKLYK